MSAINPGIGVCRRLLEDVDLANITVTWVKVRGHSGDTGNDMADDAATQGMNGHDRHLMPVAQYVNDLLGRMDWREDEAVAARDPDVMDAISEVETNARDVGSRL
jgi:hypothetical protein